MLHQIGAHPTWALLGPRSHMKLQAHRPKMKLVCTFDGRFDEDIPATLDVNKGDGLRHTSHEENEDDVNQVMDYVSARTIKHIMSNYAQPC